MITKKDIDFIKEMSNYFEKLVPSAKEDMAHWAYVYNSENCKRISKEMEEYIST